MYVNRYQIFKKKHQRPRNERRRTAQQSWRKDIKKSVQRNCLAFSKNSLVHKCLNDSNCLCNRHFNIVCKQRLSPTSTIDIKDKETNIEQQTIQQQFMANRIRRRSFASVDGLNDASAIISAPERKVRKQTFTITTLAANIIDQLFEIAPDDTPFDEEDDCYCSTSTRRHLVLFLSRLHSNGQLSLTENSEVDENFIRIVINGLTIQGVYLQPSPSVLIVRAAWSKFESLRPVIMQLFAEFVAAFQQNLSIIEKDIGNWTNTDEFHLNRVCLNTLNLVEFLTNVFVDELYDLAHSSSTFDASSSDSSFGPDSDLYLEIFDCFRKPLVGKGGESFKVGVFRSLVSDQPLSRTCSGASFGNDLMSATSSVLVNDFGNHFHDEVVESDGDDDNDDDDDDGDDTDIEEDYTNDRSYENDDNDDDNMFAPISSKIPASPPPPPTNDSRNPVFNYPDKQNDDIGNNNNNNSTSGFGFGNHSNDDDDDDDDDHMNNNNTSKANLFGNLSTATNIKPSLPPASSSPFSNLTSSVPKTGFSPFSNLCEDSHSSSLTPFPLTPSTPTPPTTTPTIPPLPSTKSSLHQISSTNNFGNNDVDDGIKEKKKEEEEQVGIGCGRRRRKRSVSIIQDPCNDNDVTSANSNSNPIIAIPQMSMPSVNENNASSSSSFGNNEFNRDRVEDANSSDSDSNDDDDDHDDTNEDININTTNTTNNNIPSRFSNLNSCSINTTGAKESNNTITNSPPPTFGNSINDVKQQSSFTTSIPSSSSSPSISSSLFSPSNNISPAVPSNNKVSMFSPSPMTLSPLELPSFGGGRESHASSFGNSFGNENNDDGDDSYDDDEEEEEEEEEDTNNNNNNTTSFTKIPSSKKTFAPFASLAHLSQNIEEDETIADVTDGDINRKPLINASGNVTLLSEIFTPHVQQDLNGGVDENTDVDDSAGTKDHNAVIDPTVSDSFKSLSDIILIYSSRTQWLLRIIRSISRSTTFLKHIDTLKGVIETMMYCCPDLTHILLEIVAVSWNPHSVGQHVGLIQMLRCILDTASPLVIYHNPATLQRVTRCLLLVARDLNLRHTCLIKEVLGFLQSKLILAYYIFPNSIIRGVFNEGLYSNSKVHWDEDVRQMCDEQFDAFLDAASVG
eukprot:TRINITY_DN273_c1_g2_i1.p1 TRINITY_DN273_c1_g2~~TRINITY_DN273_c1_g2_i1.p1  ORF type:complete len:1130 (-),score=382.82 TRINITY_DN273_c1_g2_i1:210-3599(-)